MTERRFPSPWTVEVIPGGLVVRDANGQSLAYVYSREDAADAHMAKMLTEDEARRIASNIAKLPELLRAGDHSEVDFPEGGGIARLGEILYWAGCLVAVILVFVAGYKYFSLPPVVRSYFPWQDFLPIPAKFGGLAILAWLVGRAALDYSITALD